MNRYKFPPILLNYKGLGTLFPLIQKVLARSIVKDPEFLTGGVPNPKTDMSTYYLATFFKKKTNS